MFSANFRKICCIFAQNSFKKSKMAAKMAAKMADML